MSKTKRKKKLYVVGYDGDGQCLYGKDIIGNLDKTPDYIDPMTEFQAKNYLKKMPNNEAVIYKLVPVKL